MQCSFLKHSATIGISVNGLAGDREVCPGTETDSSGRQRDTMIFEREQRGQRQTPSRRVAGKNDLFRENPLGKKGAVSASGILNGTWEGVFRSQTVAQSEYPRCGESRKAGGQGTMGLGGAEEVAASVKIEDQSPGLGLRANDPLSGQLCLPAREYFHSTLAGRKPHKGVDCTAHRPDTGILSLLPLDQPFQ